MHKPFHRSHPQKLQSVWSALRIRASDLTWFLKYAQSTQLYSQPIRYEHQYESYRILVWDWPKVAILGANRKHHSLLGWEYPFTPGPIGLLILTSHCHACLLTLVIRIWCYIKTGTLSWYFIFITPIPSLFHKVLIL